MIATWLIGNFLLLCLPDFLQEGNFSLCLWTIYISGTNLHLTWLSYSWLYITLVSCATKPQKSNLAFAIMSSYEFMMHSPHEDNIFPYQYAQDDFVWSCISVDVCELSVGKLPIWHYRLSCGVLLMVGENQLSWVVATAQLACWLTVACESPCFCQLVLFLHELHTGRVN